MPKPKLQTPPIQEASSYLWLALASCLKGDSDEAKAFAHNAARIMEKTPLNELFTVFGDYLDVRAQLWCSAPLSVEQILYLNNHLYQTLLTVTSATLKYISGGISEYEAQIAVEHLQGERAILLDFL